ncbi:MAG TPA: hypothetical protein VK644_08090 [Chitinophagaceae bacterium]|jgi:uncharacterized coiled-coil DUF342 family protein|nr:hypothetical protein [Chitinophagaceae bacterium]
MTATELKLKNIQDKLQLLLKQHAGLQKENLSLKQSLDEIHGKVNGYQAEIDGLKEKADILKFSAGEMTEEDKKKFEKRISTYLKEIDRCIAMLSE